MRIKYQLCNLILCNDENYDVSWSILVNGYWNDDNLHFWVHIIVLWYIFISFDSWFRMRHPETVSICAYITLWNVWFTFCDSYKKKPPLDVRTKLDYFDTLGCKRLILYSYILIHIFLFMRKNFHSEVHFL